ncbi:MAG TPA: CHAD domain-containing protein [Paracoccaceae bacterium]|nr:CHAD domain-containing protein [Paracoccaceae bacterium]
MSYYLHMVETELKILLDDATEAALLCQPLLARPGSRRPRPQILTSIYFDTPDRALASRGIALRVRKVGRRWIQTIKKAENGIASGLSTPEEVERPVRSPAPDLTCREGDGLVAEAAKLAGPDGLAPVFETHVRRTIHNLAVADGGSVELAIDHGEIRAGDRIAPIREAELELKAGGAHAVFEAARLLFPCGPIRFASFNKAERGFRLADRGETDPELAPRHAADIPLSADMPVELAARDIFRECADQVAANLAVCLLSDHPEGAHQLRVGLRRLRTAFTLFGASLGKEALAPLGQAARRLAQSAGRLRDMDVLIDRIVATELADSADAKGREALTAALAGLREQVRTEVRAELAEREATRFVLDLVEFVETRGWLRPEDWDQTARLATPIGALAPALLGRRLRKALRMGADVRDMSVEDRHVLRKEIKKLRYAVEFFLPLWKPKKSAAFVKALKRLQETFGDFNDAAMAEAFLTGPDRSAAEHPDAQRAAGFVLGSLAQKVRCELPEFAARWKAFRATRPFWT